MLLFLLYLLTIFSISEVLGDGELTLTEKFKALLPTNAFKYAQNTIACFERNSSPRQTARSVQHSISYTSPQPVLNLGAVMDGIDFHHVDVLSRCIRKYLPTHFENRHFVVGGGNNVTYLSGFSQLLIPEFVEHMKQVVSAGANAAGWRPHPRHLGIRCVENLVYSSGGNLSFHTDSDSIYTVVTMLSPDSDYVGGKFVIKSRDRKSEWSIGLGRGSSFMFDSNAMHAVEPVAVGTRNVLVMEFWAYEDGNLDDARPPVGFFKTKPMIPQLLIGNQCESKSGNGDFLSLGGFRLGHSHVFLLGLMAGLGLGTILHAKSGYILIRNLFKKSN